MNIRDLLFLQSCQSGNICEIKGTQKHGLYSMLMTKGKKLKFKKCNLQKYVNFLMAQNTSHKEWIIAVNDKTKTGTLCASHLQAHFSQKYWLEPSRISGSTNARSASSYEVQYTVNCSVFSRTASHHITSHHCIYSSVGWHPLLELRVNLNIQQIDEICGWSYDNKVNINTKKTKEVLLGSVSKDPPPVITINNSPVERVQSFKFLGVLLTSSLSWSEHITAVCTKASKRLYFLKLLKHCGMMSDDLLYYYKTVIRPVTEYTCAVWHSSITAEQRDH